MKMKYYGLISFLTFSIVSIMMNKSTGQKSFRHFLFVEVDY